MAGRLIPSLVLGALVVAGCGGSDGNPDSSTSAVPSSSPSSPSTPSSASTPAAAADVERTASSPIEETVSGLDMARDQIVPSGAPEPLVAFDEIRSGGPPPDGIPPIDEPEFVTAADVDFLADSEPVLALDVDGDARAYPVQILTWHEIVNDTVGGVPMTITYCPLCNSAVAYDRRLEDRILDFGTSGLLYNSALVMYDRQTETLWSHFTGEGIVGELTGDTLTTFPVATVSWKTWRDAHPDGLVLSRDTGFTRDYGRNPYPGYDDVDGVPFLFEGDVDGRYTALTRIVGIELNDAALGIPLVDLQNAQVITGEIDGTALVAFWTAGTNSALDDADIASGNDVGATGVFVPEHDGTDLTFVAQGDGTFSDDQTGSTWTVLGVAVDGPLDGVQLEPLVHVDTFWFAWSTFRTDTDVLTG
ncbi:MAG: DUF3179 domain-containing protein [Ilumatobacteraceae bacterium]